MRRRWTRSTTGRLALDALAALALAWMVVPPRSRPEMRRFDVAPSVAPEIKAGRDAFAGGKVTVPIRVPLAARRGR